MSAHSRYTRRTVLKALGASSGWVALSGCEVARWIGVDSAKAQAQGGIALHDTIDVRAIQGLAPEENVLKLFRAVADPVRNRVYVAGIMTRHLGVLDGASEQWIGTVDTGIENNAYKYLALDPIANRLYVRDGSNNQLWAVEVESGKIIGPVDVPAAIGTMVADSKRNLLYLVTGEAPGFRAFDGATLELAYSSNEMGDGINQVVYDEGADALYILDGKQAGPQGKLHRFDPVQKKLAQMLTFDLPPGQRPSHLAYDVEQKRFIVAVAGRTLLILDEQGQELRSIALPRELEFQDMLFDSANGRIVAAFIERPQNGEISGKTGHALAYDPDTGRTTGELSFGRKIHSMALNPATGKIYLPNGDASIAWSIAPDFGSVTPLRLGDSLEQVIPALGGDVLFMPSRLGGNYVLAYDVNGGTYDTFEAGTWPIPLRTDRDGGRLFVLNAWDSTLSVYSNSPIGTLLGTIPLDLPAGSTDRLPDLAIDSTRKLAFAAYPEFGQIAVVDWERMTATAVITVQGFQGGDVGGGPGQLQVLVNEAAGRLFVLWGNQGQVDVYDVENDYALLEQVRLPRLQGPLTGFDQMSLDAEKNRLFVGPVELDATSGRLTGRQLVGSRRVFALDEAQGQYWVSGSQFNQNVFLAVDQVTLQELSEAVAVGPVGTVTPQFSFDPARRRIYVGHMTSVTLEVYGV